jgi:hypothetical protein
MIKSFLSLFKKKVLAHLQGLSCMKALTFVHLDDKSICRLVIVDIFLEIDTILT